MKYTKEDIVKEIKDVAAKLETDTLTQSIFEQNKKSGIGLSTIRYHFGTWNEAIKEAGLKPMESSELIKALKERQTYSEDVLLLELVRLYNEYKKVPTYSIMNAKGKYSIKPYSDRWGNIENAFMIAKNKYPDKIIENIIVNEQNDSKSSNEIEVVPTTIKPKNYEKTRIVFGEPINFRGLRFAPVNEQGVVYLFGMTSHELGYLIESVRTAYPDCEGKRCFDKENNQWEHVRIEFEYKSSNFKEHNHKVEDTDIIVCWIHDWKDCPLEILELKSVIKYLKNE